MKNKDEMDVKMVVNYHLFPEVKFLDIDEDLAYDKDRESIPQFVIQKVGLAPNLDECLWWKSVKKHVNQAMNQNRSDCCTGVKNAFMSKFNNFVKSYIQCTNMFLYFIDLLANYGTSKQKIFSKEALLKGRKHHLTYELFWRVFLPCITRKKV